MEAKKIPLRNEISDNDKWDLSTLYKKDIKDGKDYISIMYENLKTLKQILPKSENN